MQNNNRNKSTPKKRTNKTAVNGSAGVVTIPRSSLIAPQQMRVTLKWWKSLSMNLSAIATSAVRFSPSSALDPDPLGANVPLGFPEWAHFYNSYRVLSSRANVDIINTGDVPCVTTLFPSNTDPGASPSANQVTASKMQAYAVSRTGPLIGGPVLTLSNQMSTQKIFGNRMVLTDDNFAALVNTVPVNNWYWVLTFYCLAVSPKPIIANFEMEIDIEFYDRANLVQQ
jgi:hypothetical protein